MPKVDVELSDLDSNSNNSDVFSHQTKINDEISTNRSNNDDTDVSSSHSNGQRLHSIHMLILPLIPVGILLGQNTSNYISHSSSANEIKNVEQQLKFQIQHSIFRTKIRGGEATIFEVIDWYNQITSFLLTYISYSIHDSDVSDFYRYIISFKNILRSLEYASKTGVYGLRYFTTGNLDRVHYHSLIKNEMLRNEYLNQTFNFIPSLRKEYEDNIRSKTLEDIYHGILEKNASEIGDISYIVNYFSHQIKYQRNTRLIIEKLAKSIGKFVEKEFQKYNSRKIIPLASASMFRYSTLYDEKVSIFRQEKRRNEKLLTELLPLPIIREMKRGLIPRPVAFSSVTVFLCDIVGFTKLASESTAQQIIQFLNSLYNLFDSRLENYDVYKVETIGDAYMVASGIPIENENHAPEIAKMSLDIIAKVVTFEVQHKPGYRLRIRVGIHSGDCVWRYIAGQLEALSKPMKIQISDSTKSLLEKDGTFTISSRGSPIHIKGFGSVHTYWLLGRKVETNSSYISDGKSSNYR
ncbi:Receptor-type guanylate cyclase gcy-12,Guanylate cyclase 2G,Olfactory guanylyl cyclase GC-D,Atrial natriuretic peptide receptor 2,Atrial natriuretic peptide receptor 1,Receptor-type guanylate cyclase gcy-6,Receptor-type guanylate cyclase gcy-13,Guanylyl cyclase GC-E,Retinal guanylyl cyclase 1 [Lepeophtheirus salmonis]|uniref:Uncharacterized protein n=1 Tax=Lepeophtheirus salmonis TaxID=72036 RepID=A0A7R8H745_LEPSM|nr:Receptor-type guanylate cyclase gcy-12,Guanylate cyclase 2G,Olfactory guanylyl cyclase GC-D,Atrial natriuretic peptide receptor 2,Atrial natriuretic peptide receptor 1,Receptor-type guanylate cyclase gcy-6,Receptor-type guanylate cyclase gcy-13,Guanylyl cyclase GC-E,Retinal guanylyl cyclase 1 [Lepeophtheirus salmonis]CAF2895107.1 Receptor-type guanylate cyclase gcy-12,Guanylate cyclase 2G,Olfactory guanylyl cyclase GC-D,Atrial natriuretic peptide receptor 2,Atrial natriuretic peptide receptor 1